MLNGTADFRKEPAVPTIDRQMMGSPAAPYMAAKDMLRPAWGRNLPSLDLCGISVMDQRAMDDVLSGRPETQYHADRHQTL